MLFLLIVLVTTALAQEYVIRNISFPDDFLFGTASSAYQIEGAWDEDGKGENIWDRYLHNNPEIVVDQSNGDVACDSYHRWQEDIAILKSIGVNSYRFSISWPRILPNGHTTVINQAGVNYYRNIINELKANNITPLVTLFHWDLPQELQEIGGTLNNYFADWFGDYARLCFELFGDDVKYWATFNEGITYCVQDYSGTLFAPGINASGVHEYQCAHSLIKAHARAWHIYDTDFRATQNGKVGMVIVGHWFQPASNSTADIEAAEIQNQFMFGWFGHPVFFGDYPDSMKDRIAYRSELQSYARSRLPEFTEDEKVYIKGTLDYVGLNVYVAAVATPRTEHNVNQTGWRYDSLINYYLPSEWLGSGIDIFKVSPWAVRGLCKWIKDTYNDPEIIITETGYPDVSDDLDDVNRTNFIRWYMSSAIEAIEYDNVKLIGYTHWSFLDNFEWHSGFTQNFGLVHVNYTDGNLTRTLKNSALYFKKVIATKCLVDECVPGTDRTPSTSGKVNPYNVVFIVMLLCSLL